MSLSLDLYWLDLFEAARPWLTRGLQYLNRPFALVELFATACGLFGSLLLALKGRQAPLGWLFFAASNIGWLSFANGHGHQFMFVQQIGFSITSLIGIYTWIIVPAVDHHYEQLVRKAIGL